MRKEKTQAVGIDVSKDTFNAHWAGRDGEYRNCLKGWRKLLADAPQDASFAMEATGYYHHQMALYLHSKGRAVMVFNPLRVRRWMQSLGTKAKTDKRDARLIAKYAETEEAGSQEWKPMTPRHARARTIVSVLSGLSHLMTAASNMRHAAALAAGKADKDLPEAMTAVWEACGEQKKKLEAEMCGIASEIFTDAFRLLKTIPGIGPKTAAVMLVCAKGLEGFQSHRQLASFIGVAPTVYESGTSVKGKGGVAKTGNPYLRALLFMCAFTASKTCAPCARLHARLIAKGKPKMVALTAVMHRLVKIAFGVVSSGEPYRGGKFAGDKSGLG
jgi:transposase